MNAHVPETGKIVCEYVVVQEGYCDVSFFLTVL